MKNIVLAISLIGILILLIIINTQEPELSNISAIKNKSLNERVKFQGQIIEIKIFKSNFTIAKIRDNFSAVEIICNCENIKYHKNKTLEITGRLTTYQGNLQVQADKIILIR